MPCQLRNSRLHSRRVVLASIRTNPLLSLTSHSPSASAFCTALRSPFSAAINSDVAAAVSLARMMPSSASLPRATPIPSPPCPAPVSSSGECSRGGRPRVEAGGSGGGATPAPRQPLEVGGRGGPRNPLPGSAVPGRRSSTAVWGRVWAALRWRLVAVRGRIMATCSPTGLPSPDPMRGDGAGAGSEAGHNAAPEPPLAPPSDAVSSPGPSPCTTRMSAWRPASPAPEAAGAGASPNSSSARLWL